MNKSDKVTALIKASVEGDIELIQTILESSPDVSVNSWRQTTPLISAAYEGHTEVVKYLVDASANLEDRDESGDTALIGAVYGGHRETVAYLLSAGASVHLKDRENGWTIMEWALHESQLQVVNLLIENCACQAVAKRLLEEKSTKPRIRAIISEAFACYRRRVITTFCLPSSAFSVYFSPRFSNPPSTRSDLMLSPPILVMTHSEPSAGAHTSKWSPSSSVSNAGQDSSGLVLRRCQG
jgi:hypothetical protein